MMTRCGRVIVVLLILGLSVSPVSAQRAGRWTFHPQYSMVLPMSDETREFVDGFSWRGGTIDIERGATDYIAIGASFGWHVLSEENTKTSVFPDGAISGRALRHVNSVPLMVTGKIALGSRDGIQPWFGVGGGTVWIESRTESGALAAEDTNWHRIAMGEAGLRIPRDSGATITLSARYQRAFETKGLEREYVTFSVGYLLGG